MEIAIVLVIILGGYFGLGLIAEMVAQRIPDRFEVSLFAEFAPALLKNAKLDNPSDEFKRAQQIFERLTKANSLKLRELNYRLYSSPENLPNAFAVPGGAVCLTDGLLKLIESEIGLAMVLGHELGHHQYRHALKSIGRGLFFSIAFSILTGGLGSIGGFMLDIAENKHNHSQEFQADGYGLKLVHKVYGTTQGSMEFFKKMAERSKKNGTENPYLSMLATHPLTPERLKRLQALAEKLH